MQLLNSKQYIINIQQIYPIVKSKMLSALKTTNQKFLQTDRTAYTQNRQKFLEENIKGVMGSTWDANHMTSFLNRSFYSNRKSPQKEQQANPQRKSYSIRRKKSGDYCFKNLRYDQNKSHIGYTVVNPIINNSQVSEERQKVLVDFFIKRQEILKNQSQKKRQKSPTLLCDQNSKFRYEGNSVKFKATDPLTSRYEPQKPQRVGYSLQRMKLQINQRYPHGLTGIDNPHLEEPLFYDKVSEKNNRIRLHPVSSTSFELTRDWKSKKHSVPICDEYKFRHTQCLRKFRNQNSHGYNILTNRQVNE